MQRVHSEKNKSSANEDWTGEVRFDSDNHKWKDLEQDIDFGTKPWKDGWEVSINDRICDTALAPS